MQSHEMTYQRALELFEYQGLEGITHNSLKKQYLVLAKKYHPDRGGSSETFIELRKAYLLLRRALDDPSTSSSSYAQTGGGTSGHHQYRNEGDSTHTYSGTTRGSEDIEIMRAERNRYKAGFERAQAEIEHYEHIINAQIRAINRTHKKLASIQAAYTTGRDALEQTLNDELEVLKKQHESRWWEYLLSIKKMSKEEYIQRYNSYVEAYNKRVRAYDDEFMDKLLDTYQLTLSELIDLLQS